MKLTHFKKQIIAFLLVFLLLMIANVALADCPPDSGGPCELDNPLGTGTDDPRMVVGNVIKVALGLIGAAALAMFIIGGYMWIFSAGNQEKVKKGRNTLVWAVIGLAVIFASYGLVSWVLGRLEALP